MPNANQITPSLAAEWALERAEVILGNMAQENPETFWGTLFGRRWPIHHEPLRGDARNALPEIRRAITRLREARYAPVGEVGEPDANQT